MLIEIQLNDDPIIVDEKPSNGFSEAIQQVTDWFSWIEKKDSRNLDKYLGKIIIGRKADYDLHKTKIDEVVSGLKHPIKFETYDDLNTNINLLEKALSSLSKED